MSTVKNLKQARTLPFITDLRTPRGRHIETNWFDVPDQTYGEGWSTGMEAAAQLYERTGAVIAERRRVERMMRGREFAERMRTARAARRRLRGADDRVSVAAGEIVLGGQHE